MLDPGVPEHDRRLRQVGAIDQQDSRPGGGRDRPAGPRRRVGARPAVERLLQLRPQARGVDVAGHRQDGVVRVVEGLPELLQLRAIDLADVVGGQHPAVGVLLAEQLVVEVGLRQLPRVVVARGDRRQHLVAHVPHLALGERRVQQHVGQEVEAERGVLRQRRTGDRGPLVRGLRVERAADEVDGARDVIGAAGSCSRSSSLCAASPPRSPRRPGCRDPRRSRPPARPARS